MATATAMALEDGREGTVRVARASFDSVVDEDEDGSAASAASASASASEEEGDGFSSARDEGAATTTLRSVLTRKPSVAALKALGTLGRGAGSDEEEEGTRARAGTTREGEDEDGVCSLSEFAMVLNAAGWDTDAAGQMSVDVIVKQLELLRGKVSSEEDLSDVLGFNVKADLVGRADSAGLVSVGAIGNVLYRGLSKSKSARTLSSDRERFEDVLERRAVKNISKVLGHGDGDDAIITTKDLKAKLRYYGVHSSVTDIISMMTQADIDGTGIVRVGDLSRLLAQELAQLRRLLTEKTETTVNDRFRVSLDMDREDGAATNRLLRGEAEFGVLQKFPTARSDREKPKRLVWAKEDDMCSVCLFDKSGAMMIEEQGQLVSLPAKLDYFTDVDRGVETRTIVELPAPPTPVKVQEKRGLFSCCFSS